MAPCLLVVANEQVVGLLCAQGVWYWLAQGRDLSRLTVGEAMTAPVPTLRASDLENPEAIAAGFQNNQSYLPIVDAAGKPIGLLARDRCPAALTSSSPPSIACLDCSRHELALFEHLTDTLLAGYWDWVIPSNRMYMSPGFKRMFGYEDDELPNVATPWQNLMFAEDVARVFDNFERHVASRGAVPHCNSATTTKTAAPSGSSVRGKSLSHPDRPGLRPRMPRLSSRGRHDLHPSLGRTHLRRVRRVGVVGRDCA